MSYASIRFSLFVLGTLIVYYLMKKPLRKYVLLAANLLFYASYDIRCLPFLLVVIFVSYLSAIQISKVYEAENNELLNEEDREKKKEIRYRYKNHAKKILTVSLLIILSVLVFRKYLNFMIENIQRLGIGIRTIDLLVPIGLSYYTFMAISYLLDIYWKRYESEKDPVLYAAYLSYFPHIVEGPLDRFSSFKEEINNAEYDIGNILKGAQLSLWGLIKKLVIADRIDIFVQGVLSGWTEYKGVILILTAMLYSIEMYADFSGCMDIVSGVSEMFGIRMTQNFNHPFLSETIAEYWRRWHISLGSWFSDYLYLPIFKSDLIRNIRKKYKDSRPALCNLLVYAIPTFIIWLVTGLWHGASWNYIFWGLYYAFLMISAKAMEPLFTKMNTVLKIKTDTFSWKLFRILRTFMFTTLGRIFLLFTNLKDSFGYLGKMVKSVGLKFFLSGHILDYGLNTANLILLSISILILIGVDLLQEKKNIRLWLEEENLLFRWIVFFIGIFAVIIFGVYGPGYEASKFIYERF